MRYTSEAYGFSLALPDLWRETGGKRPLTFECHAGRITVQVGEAGSEPVDPDARAEALADGGFVRDKGRVLGEEANTVVLESAERNEGIVSAIRDHIVYTIVYDNVRHPVVEIAMRELLSSFRFPPLSEVAAALEKIRQDASKTPAVPMPNPMPNPVPVLAPAAAPPAPPVQSIAPPRPRVGATPDRPQPKRNRDRDRGRGLRAFGVVVMLAGLAAIFSYPVLLDVLDRALSFELVGIVGGGVFLLGLVCAVLGALKR